MKTKKIDIVICSFNRFFELKATFYALTSQLDDEKIKLINLIIISNNSNDQTNDYFQIIQKSNKFKNFFFHVEKKQGLSFARNTALHISKSEYITFLDDDIILKNNYLETLLKCLQKNPDFLGGPVIPINTHYPFWFPRSLYHRQYTMHTGFFDVPITGANFTAKKNIFSITGNFDTSLGMSGYKINLGEERKIIETYLKIKKIPNIFYCQELAVSIIIPSEKLHFFSAINRLFSIGRMSILVKNNDPGIFYLLTNIFISFLIISPIFLIFNILNLQKQKKFKFNIFLQNKFSFLFINLGKIVAIIKFFYKKPVKNC